MRLALSRDASWSFAAKLFTAPAARYTNLGPIRVNNSNDDLVQANDLTRFSILSPINKTDLVNNKTFIDPHQQKSFSIRIKSIHRIGHHVEVIHVQ